MSRQTFGKGLPLLDSLKDILYHGLNLGTSRELLANRQAAIQRQPRVNERRQLLGKEHDLLGADAAESPTQVQLQALAGLPCLNLKGGHPHSLESDRCC